MRTTRKSPCRVPWELLPYQFECLCPRGHKAHELWDRSLRSLIDSRKMKRLTMAEASLFLQTSFLRSCPYTVCVSFTKHGRRMVSPVFEYPRKTEDAKLVAWWISRALRIATLRIHDGVYRLSPSSIDALVKAMGAFAATASSSLEVSDWLKTWNNVKSQPAVY